MNKKDIERMISLADDRYVDEIFRDRISGGRKNIALRFAAAAAALAVVVGGISYFVSTAGDADKITGDPIVSEEGSVDYSQYFQNHDESAIRADDWDSWSVESAGIFCYFSDSEYVKSVMPFDMNSYTNANCNFFYDHRDEVKAVLIHANNSDDNTSESAKRLYVEVYKRGEFFPHLALDRCKSMKRFDVDVYGFDPWDTEEKEAGVVFAMADKEYLIGGNNLSFDEIGIIMDSIIENGLWADRFDISKAEMEYFDNINAEISLAEANEISPFAGRVPQMQSFGDMRLNNGTVSYYACRDENKGIVPKWLYFTYFNGTDRDICLQYFTEAAADEVQHIEKTVKIDDIELDKLSEYRDGNSHVFAIDYGDFKINVWANNCTDNELLHCITAISIGANGVVGNSSRNISLVEANNIAPFAGHIPQSENIGGMRLSGVSTSEASFNGETEENYIYINYLQESPHKYITLYYTCGDEVPNAFFAETFTAEQLEEIAQKSEQGSPDMLSYSFSLEFDGFRVNIKAECNKFEMKKCVSEINRMDYTAVTLAEANTVAPFAGYVPQNETVGDMKLGSVQYNGRNIVLDYSYNGENRFSYIGLTYTEDKEVTADYSVITLEELINSDIVILRDDSEDNRSNYKFAVECGGFYVCIDSEKCTTEELYGCVLDTLMENAPTDLGVQTGVHLSNGITLADSTLAKANKIPPFAGYVPQSESFGSLKLSAVSEGYFDGDVSPCLIHMVYVDDVDNPKQMLTAHFFSDYRAVSLEEIKVSAVPISELSADKLNDYKDASGTSILIDCGDFKILVGANANCSKEDIWRFINGVKGLTVHDAQDDPASGFSFTPFGSLAEANKLAPFAGYVPNVKTIGDMNIYLRDGCEVSSAESEEYGRVLNIAYQSAVTSGSTYGESDFKAISLNYTEKKAYNIPTSPVISVSDVPIANLDELKTDGVRPDGRVCYRFVIDCGTCYITVAADCLPGEMKVFITGIRTAWVTAQQERAYEGDALAERLLRGGGEALTMEKVKELSKKGDALDWSDFTDFSGTDIGSGLFIMSYDVEGTDYTVLVGGAGVDVKPMYISLCGADGKKIDIRYDSVEEFLGEKPFLNYEF